jgi:hypothetical protein
MAQPGLFTADEKEEDPAATAGCAYPRCNKIPEPGSAFCPHHIAVSAWKSATPKRKRARAAQLREKRKQEEVFLAASPLRVPDLPAEPPQRKRRTEQASIRRPLKANRRAKIPA